MHRIAPIIQMFTNKSTNYLIMINFSEIRLKKLKKIKQKIKIKKETDECCNRYVLFLLLFSSFTYF